MTAERLMIAFVGTEVPAEVAQALGNAPYAGVSLFIEHNVRTPAQVRSLTAALQHAARADGRPLLIAADQEGGQLNALGDGPTAFAGAMALGAAGDPDLAERVARATAVELRALGVNVNYAPVCDLATAPDNPALGIRSFGDSPAAVGELAAAYVRGLQSEGVAATVKHFPGHGEATTDLHHGIAVVAESREEMESRELVPFRAAFAAGARLAMAGHHALPALTGDPELPASLAEPVVRGLLRDELGFDGLAITDALDMHALAQGAAQVVDVITAVRAGEDLLLGTADRELIARLSDGLAQAEKRRLVDPASGEQTRRRLTTLRRWLSGFDQPALDVVGCAEHRAIAHELAERSITLVRNDDARVPWRPGGTERIVVVQTPPARLTPADTSDRVVSTLAAAIRRRHPATDELLTSAEPTDSEIAALRERVVDYDYVVVGTAAAHLRPREAALAKALIAANPGAACVALRSPWDLKAYPEARTYLCSYGILEPSMDALAGSLFGEIGFRGRLPVEISGMYERGHGLV
ncbi:MAG TPA: glycoside hydrolase family 3 N-terminal domain-containing protein [Candidatus Limnocylindrales bacterium]|jgi:beta-N-acetylhexosaminidase